MTSRDSHAAAQGFDRLPRLAPDPDRAARVRARCRTRLGRRRRPPAPAVVMTRRAWRLLAPAVVGGLCVVYIIELVTTTLRLEGVLD